MNTVVGLFDNTTDADQAVQALHRHGFEDDQISVATRDDAFEGGATLEGGALAGGATGGLIGLMAGLSTFAIPGIGPVLATGAIAASLQLALAGAGIGAVTGGL